MTWFERLTGLSGESKQLVQESLVLDGERIISRANGRSMVCGRLETPSLGELRVRAGGLDEGGLTTVREVVADVQALHCDAEMAGALFQVASQFNLLEMMSPSVTPEEGVGCYEHDQTQGPACAIAAGAGTIYRNYFVPVSGQTGRWDTGQSAATGQSASAQIDCLADLGDALGNADGGLWTMRNGYALPSSEGLAWIASRLQSAKDREELRALLRIGIQWGTQVTIAESGHCVSQAYCSALPIAYSRLPVVLWESFARLVLGGAYEATLLAGVLNARATGNRKVFLTMLGGGAFGNPTHWIIDAVDRALALSRNAGLDVAIVSYRASSPAVQEVVERYRV